jgi:hypothetical protein
MQRQRIAPDGSCLFSSIDFLTSNGVLNADAPEKLREFCASTILGDGEKFSKVYLDKEPSDYAAFIRSPHEYGGEIEILILSQLKQVIICVVSLESLTVLNYSPETFEPPSPRKRIYILYNGQHYDAIVSTEGACTFNDEDAHTFDALALALATEEKAKRDLELRTRVRKRIRCSCGAVVADTAAFQAHAEVVEHPDDWGYDCEEVEVEELVASASDD